ncbi:hypothetical protein VroAM7_46010 [Vibrio rotiferianus]|uniref:Uncharacterized protein n=1 Tax=Vibrio rotiferianus TaxID=190895 RepID=A0A510IFK5_9VIBR|nr:hypothetical protein VroAM7_46010 [Vibrio rotiferianus]
MRLILSMQRVSDCLILNDLWPLGVPGSIIDVSANAAKGVDVECWKEIASALGIDCVGLVA